jgi:DNA helicase-2/ATP-dependent DNA helicase PcrA
MAVNLNHLNAQQREAVLHPMGPLLILAGAGSGKTSTMAYRIAHLIADRHMPGHAILGLSFTNKAALELRERVTQLVEKNAGKRAVKGLKITTFHSLCVRLLRAHSDQIGFQNNFTILDQNDQLDVLKQVLRNIRLDDRKFDPQVILFEIGQAKNRFLSGDQAEQFFLESGRLASDYALAASASFQKYQDQLKVLNAMDFDDLIFKTVQLLESQEAVREQYNLMFRHVLVDEYQDTNPAQFQILRLLTERQQNICVVGDDDQSIYSWRGADPTHILEFSKYYPGAHVIALEQNYRSTSRILEAANSVIEKNKARYPKKLWSDRGVGEPLTEVVLEEDRAEAEFVAEEILRRSREMNASWKDFAVLYRSNAQSRVFEEALRRNTIPYHIVGGLSFLERKEVKDVLSYWRLIVNSKDDASLRRIINWPGRGIGRSSMETLGSHAFENQISVFKALGKARELTPKTASAIQSFLDLILKLQEELEAAPAAPEAVAAWARRSLERIQAKKAIEEECDDPVQAGRKWENVEELVHSVGQLMVRPEDPVADLDVPPITGTQLLREFINRMTLEAQESEKDKDQDAETQKNKVTLLTLHGAKGLEYPVVFLVGLEEGFLPHKRTIEEATDFGEERRLCYVGITRARDHLFLTRAKNRIRFGKPVPRNPSRFLDEVPSDLMVRVDQSLSPDLSSKAAREAHEDKVKNYLAGIRALIQ